jgi:hypothetical protein
MDPVTVGIIVGAVIGLLVGVHGGSGYTHYRHQRAGCPQGTGHRKPRLFASLARGVFVWGSLPLGDGFRIGHKL